MANPMKNSPFSQGKFWEFSLPQNFGKTLVFMGYDFWVGFPMESQLQQVPCVTSECLCDQYDLSKSPTSFWLEMLYSSM
jgi:hypothetical protein